MDPRTDIVQVAALLVAARTVVTDPARWCAYPHALDANGHRCEGRSNIAVCWGALGALDRAAADADASHHIFLEARRQVNQASVRVADAWTGTAWVLDYDAAHTMTVAIFDEAIRAMPRPEAPGALDILAIARTLIARPERWAQGAIALDRKGRALIAFNGGCRFCAAGALGLATNVMREDDPTCDRTGPAFEQAERLLDCGRLQARRVRKLHRPQRARHPRQRRRHVRPRPRHGTRGRRSRPGGKKAMTATDPTPRGLLVEARTLIARPEAWTQGTARARRGRRARRRRTRRRRLVVRHRSAQLRHVPPCGFPGRPDAVAAGPKPCREDPHRHRAGTHPRPLHGGHDLQRPDQSLLHRPCLRHRDRQRRQVLQRARAKACLGARNAHGDRPGPSSSALTGIPTACRVPRSSASAAAGRPPSC